MFVLILRLLGKEPQSRRYEASSSNVDSVTALITAHNFFAFQSRPETDTDCRGEFKFLETCF